MGNCIVVVQFDLPKRTEEQAIKGGTSTAPIYRDLGTKGGEPGCRRAVVHRGAHRRPDEALRRAPAPHLV